MVQGLSHITFITSDLDRMELLITRVLDGTKIYDSGNDTFSLSRERFFDVAGIWIATMEGAPLPERSYNHVAFQVADSTLDDKQALIQKLGFELRDPRPRVSGEGRSVYFYDHDNHLFELHSGTLEARLKRYQE